MIETHDSVSMDSSSSGGRANNRESIQITRHPNPTIQVDLADERVDKNEIGGELMTNISWHYN